MKLLANLLVFFLVFTSINSKSSAENHESIKVFGEWGMINYPSMCFAFNHPYKTRNFEGFRNKPYVLIKYIEKDRFSLNIRPGFKVNQEKSVLLTIGTKTHMLKNLDFYNAITFSADQDIKIINSLLTEADYFKVESFSSSDRTAIDFYSLDGLKDALHYMNHNCVK